MLAPIQILCITVFTLACAIIVYALFGYPLLLNWQSRRSDNPVHKDEKLRRVSVVIAVYNGEKFLERKLKTIFALNYPRDLIDVLVVSDGSTDRTDDIARSFAGQGVKFMRVPHAGKAAALNAAVPTVSGEIVVLCDVRQTLDPDCLRNVIACFGDPKVGAVSPQTIIVQGETHEETTTSLYWRYELWIRQRMTRIDSTFGYSGAFAAIRRSLWTPLPPGTLLDDVYEPLVAFFKGYRILMEPTATMYDFPTALQSEFRRKVRLQAGLYQMLKIMPQLLSSRNRMRSALSLRQVRAHRHTVLHDCDCAGDDRSAALLAGRCRLGTGAVLRTGRIGWRSAGRHCAEEGDLADSYLCGADGRFAGGGASVFRPAHQSVEGGYLPGFRSRAGPLTRTQGANRDRSSKVERNGSPRTLSIFVSSHFCVITFFVSSRFLCHPNFVVIPIFLSS